MMWELTVQMLLTWTGLLPFTSCAPSEWPYAQLSKQGSAIWYDTYPSCQEGYQSPINIDTNKVWYSASLTAFDMFGFETIPNEAHWQMVNNGIQVQVKVDGDYILEEGGLPGKYKAIQFHYHWGSKDDHGSEHTMNGKPSAMEMHIVHINTQYDNLQDAAANEDGIAVLAFLVEVDNKKFNAAYKHLVDHFGKIPYQGDAYTMRPVPLLSLLPANLNDYYRYSYGSMTTPPCLGKIIWTVFKEKIHISEKQMEAFRTMFNSGTRESPNVPIMDNFRPPQPLLERVVYSSDPKDSNFLSAPWSSPLAITVAAFVGFVLLYLALR